MSLRYRKISRGIILPLILCFCVHGVQAATTWSGDLPRRAELGFRFSTDDSLKITKVDEKSPAALAGLVVGDVIEKINGKKYRDVRTAAAQLRRTLGDSSLSLAVKRNKKIQTVSFSVPPKALENIEGLDSHYGVVDVSDSVKLRSIVATPSGNKRPLPTVFFMQWVSCGSIEFNPRGTSTRIQSKLIKEAGRTLIRVERSASGDSTGPACHELDYNTEIDHYYRAFLALKNHPLVDPNNIVIYGSSLGSTTAPLLAERLIDTGHKVAGVMIQGGGAVTYFERMLNFERIYLERKADEQGNFFPASEIHSEFVNRSLFYTEYLLKGRHPDRIAKDSKTMANVRNNIRGLNEKDQYGRPFSWHQQAAQHNFLKAWERIDAPVLVVYNTFEQFEMRHGHKIITDMINRWRPGTATYVEQKDIGHSNYRYSTAEAAYNYQGGNAEPESISAILVNWLKAQN